MILRLLYIYNGNPYTAKMAFLFWDGPLGTDYNGVLHIYFDFWISIVDESYIYFGY